ncbi:MAG: ATP-binding protein, partial [Candidatus Promineifilaceae bacterium]|nr:ATP-binding protein [Candidatus Promineifilaceae bacterium]
MAGSEQLLEDLRETLLDCAPVGSYTALRALFVDARLSRWRHLLPYGESPADQADALIVLLHDRAGEGGAPGLALLLRAVAGRLEEADACHGRLLALAERVEASSGAAHADEVDGLFPALAEARRQTSDVYDLSGDFRGAVINIQSTIVQEAEVVELESLPPEPGEPPYRGLQYFTEADADRFFGRERLTARLVARLRPEPGQARFLAVVGASGSGKSSLVRAGLLPALRRGQRLADGTVPPTDSASWAIRTFTPTAHPLEALAAALLPEGDALAEVAALVRELEENPQSLGPLVRQVVARASGSHLLLVVDQFEELFTQCRRPELRQAFVEALLAAVDPAAGRPATVVVVLRADFYAHCAEYPGLRELVSRQQEYIGAMNRDELFEAIVRPAALGDWRIQEGLVELMLDEVEHEPGALPLLSHALLETWARRRGRVMTLSGYTEAGGVRGAIAQTAETIFRERLSEKQQHIARSVFLRLTEPGEQRGDEEAAPDTRRRVPLAELLTSREDEEAVAAVLEILSAARLVTTNTVAAAQVRVVEVAHEALIREWPTLRQWLDSDRERLLRQRELTEAAYAWEELGRDEGALFRGARLAQTLAWAAQSPEPLSLLEQEFLEASRALEERETERALRLARATQRQRLLAGLALLLIIVAAALGLNAIGAFERREMNRFFNIAVDDFVIVEAADSAAVGGATAAGGGAPPGDGAVGQRRARGP